MKKFMNKNFLLETRTAEKLYHEAAAPMPIIDYHCHLSAQEIAEDKQYDNISQIWLSGDHYKWRAMRTNGVEEKYCTGDASDYEKFIKWAETVPYTLMNPLYHWTHLELRRYFNIDDTLSPKTAKKIWEGTKSQLKQRSHSVRNMIKMQNVEVICTTDDPVDDLRHHDKIREDGFETKVFPAWRPDNAMKVENPETYNQYIDKLADVSNTDINSYKALIEALRKRHDFFHEKGSRLSDHGLETMYASDYTEKEIETIFSKVRAQKVLTPEEIDKFKTAMLYDFAVMDNEKDWVQQYHCGAMRNNNSRKFEKLGADVGFDSIGDYSVAEPMSRFFDMLDKDDQLTKTILYNLNPRDNALYATMIGNFQDGSIPGKMQWGSGWWFLDQKYGMEDHLKTLSVLGLLSRFVGMLTDSRSFLSFPRHEYFRRILSNLIGNAVENGEIPAEDNKLKRMVEDICYYNAKNYFQFPG